MISKIFLGGKKKSVISSIKFSITGRLDVEALGRTYVTYTNFDDINAFTKPRVVVRNLIFGTIDIDVEGKFEVTNEMGDKCEVEMVPSTSGQKGVVRGEIKDINGDIKFALEGIIFKKIKPSQKMYSKIN